MMYRSVLPCRIAGDVGKTVETPSASHQAKKRFRREAQAPAGGRSHGDAQELPYPLTICREAIGQGFSALVDGQDVLCIRHCPLLPEYPRKGTKAP